MEQLRIQLKITNIYSSVSTSIAAVAVLSLKHCCKHCTTIFEACILCCLVFIRLLAGGGKLKQELHLFIANIIVIISM